MLKKLITAIEEGNESLTLELINIIDKEEIIAEINEDKITVLHLAISKIQNNVVKALINKIINVVGVCK